MRLNLSLLILFIVVLAGGSLLAVDARAAARAEKIFSTRGVIWGFAFLSPDELLVTLRRGKLLYVNLADGSAREIAHNLNVVDKGQGGLLDVHFAPAQGNDYVYLTYSTESADNDALLGDTLTTALARGVWNGSELTGLTDIFIAKVEGGSGRHFGSRLEFVGDHLYMTVGDRAERDLAQSLEFHNGKILRLTRDGAAAADNPFTGDTEALPEIWSYGHRNPQGIDTDATGVLYSIEFGPRGGDELNLIEPGLNYGWPVISHGREYWGPSFDTHQTGMEQPVVFWTPSISPSGMAFYQGEEIPDWKGNLFLAVLGETHLRRLVLEDNRVIMQEPLFEELGERVRQVRTGFAGEKLYFSTDNGNIYRVVR